MSSNSEKRATRHEIAEKLTEARRELREQEQTLARLKYEWSIAKRLRRKAHNEEEREQWHVQSDAYMGMVLQQESAIEETKESIRCHQVKLSELETRSADGTQ